MHLKTHFLPPIAVVEFLKLNFAQCIYNLQVIPFIFIILLFT